MIPVGPRYDGHSLVNLVAELENRLTGQAPFSGLDASLGDRIPERSTYVFMLFDGLGSRQLSHPAARDLARAQVGTIDAPFPTTTTVSLSSIATGLPPTQHGVIGHHMWVPDLAKVVNVLKWILPAAHRLPTRRSHSFLHPTCGSDSRLTESSRSPCNPAHSNSRRSAGRSIADVGSKRLGPKTTSRRSPSIWPAARAG